MARLRRSRLQGLRFLPHGYFVLSLPALLMPAVLAAQGGATFRGTVTDSSGHPLGDVLVSLAELGRSLPTDTAGVFIFHDVPAGLYHVTLRRPQFGPITGTTRLADGDFIDLRFRMRRLVPALDTVEVTARAQVRGWRGEFERRRAAGFGAFLTSATFENRTKLSDVLASIASLDINPNGTVRSRHGSSCASVRYVVDGAPYTSGGVDDFRPEDIAAIEVYVGPAEVPLEFGGSSARCGVVVLWTRAAFGPPTLDPIQR